MVTTNQKFRLHVFPVRKWWVVGWGPVEPLLSMCRVLGPLPSTADRQTDKKDKN